MKRIITSCLMCILFGVCYAQNDKILKYVEYPFVKDDKAPSLVLTEIDNYSDSTVFCFTMSIADSIGIAINPDTYIEADGKKYRLKDIEDITYAPQRTTITEENTPYSFSLSFPLLPKNCTKCNFVEPGEFGWRLNGIEINTKEESENVCNKILANAQRMHEMGNDSYGKTYLEKTLYEFEDDEEYYYNYLLLWASLSSNIFNETEVVDDNYRAFVKSLYCEYVEDNFGPNEEMLALATSFIRDYAMMTLLEQNYEEATKILSRVLEWYKEFPEKRVTEDYAQVLTNYCLIMGRGLNRYKEVCPYLEEYTQIAHNVYGENSIQYAYALYNLGFCYYKLARYKDAEAPVVQSSNIFRVSPLSDKAIMDEIEELITQLNVYNHGKTSINSITSKNSENFSYTEVLQLIASGNGDVALPFLLKEKSRFIQAEKIDTVNLGALTNFIAQAYMAEGNLSLAQKEIDLFDKNYGIEALPDVHAYALLGEIAVIAYNLRDYEKAIKYNKLALARVRNSMNDLEKGKALANMAEIFVESNDFLQAKWYIDEATDILNERIGDLISLGNAGLQILNASAFVYSKIGEKDNSIKILEKIVKEFENNIDCLDSWTLCANNLAYFYMKDKKYDEAILLYNKLMSSDKQKIVYFAQNLALAYYYTDNPKCIEINTLVNRTVRENCIKVSNYFAEDEREKYWSYNARTLLVNSLFADKFPEAAGMAYNNELFTKQLTLQSSNTIRDYIEKSNSEQLLSLYTRISELRQFINYSKASSDSIAVWNKELHEKEHELAASVDLNAELENSFVDWQKVQKFLENDELAIEFTYIPTIYEDDVDLSYGALVLSKDSDIPIMVKLCETSDATDFISADKTDPMSISKAYDSDSHNIYKIIWGKLEPYMVGKKSIYFAPTGVINFINNEALLLQDGSRFGEKYNLIRLTSTCQIEKVKNTRCTNFTTALLYGGINYDASIEEMKLSAQKYCGHEDTPDYLSLRSEDTRGKWNFLKGSNKEVNLINQELSINGVKTRTLSLNEANEESFKELNAASPDILHLSTHGYYIYNSESFEANPFMQSLGGLTNGDIQMSKSGLLLSGANNVWTGRNAITEIEDGILTAEEIGRLDLRKTKLVILSACETAKGYIDEIDGVLGLQRGFKKAGAGTIVMTLWKIPDEATAILMSSFYKHLMEGKDVRDSLHKAQIELQSIDKNYKDPYYWAGFVVLD